jgi:hypothetical protein
LEEISAPIAGRITDNWEAFLDAEGGPTNSVGAGGRFGLSFAFVTFGGDATLTTGDEDAIFVRPIL